MNQLHLSNSSNITIDVVSNTGQKLTVLGVQAYNIHCNRNIKRINTIGDQKPAGYARLGRWYEITLSKVYVKNTSAGDGLNFYDNNKDGFDIVITRNNPDGRTKTVSKFHDCYVSDASESCEVDGKAIVENITILSSDMGDESSYKMKHMKIGTFEFPNNPEETEITLDHEYALHKFPGLKKSDIEDLGPDCAIISCSGWMFGSGTYGKARQLLDKSRTVGPQNFLHPIYTGINKVIIKSISLKHSGGAESATQYTLTVVEYDPPKVRNAENKTVSSKKSAKKKSGKVKSLSDLKKGDVVYATGNYYNKKNGGTSKKISNKKVTVTDISKNAKYPIHINTLGWIKVSSLSWSK